MDNPQAVPSQVDRFERSEDSDGFYATAVDGSGITVMVEKPEGTSASLFLRRIIKPFVEGQNTTLLVGQLDGVYLYVTEDNKLLLTKNSELR